MSLHEFLKNFLRCNFVNNCEGVKPFDLSVDLLESSYPVSREVKLILNVLLVGPIIAIWGLVIDCQVQFLEKTCSPLFNMVVVISFVNHFEILVFNKRHLVAQIRPQLREGQLLDLTGVVELNTITSDRANQTIIFFVVPLVKLHFGVVL